jgi:ABC-type sugar transport system ATPase subunit
MSDNDHTSAIEETKTEQNHRSEKMRLENIGKQFGRIIALEDVSFSVYDTEILAIVGGNGAGKSTLMNIISGVYKSTQGTIFYDDEPVEFSNPDEARNRGIETVYQDLALMNDLDVATNIFIDRFPEKGIWPFIYIDREEMYNRSGQLMKEDLDQDINPRTEVDFLSGGQRQLVAIARSLAFEPEVIILDEPTSALSIDATHLVQDTIRQLRENDITVIIVSHSLDEILGIADRIAVLYQGELVEVTDRNEINEDTLANLISTGRRSDTGTQS